MRLRSTTTIPWLPLLPVLAVLVAGGCSNNPGYLTVKGSVQIDAGGATTGFDFPSDTRLDDDRVAAPDGTIAGHCTIRPGSGGVPDVVNVGIVRTNAPPSDLGAHSFVVRADAAGGGTVTTVLGSDTFTGMAGGPCVVDINYLDANDRVAAVNVVCDLDNGSGATAHANAELHFSGCSVN